MEETAGFAPADIVDGVSGGPDETFIHPLDEPECIGDDHSVVGPRSHQRQFAGFLFLLQKALVCFAELGALAFE